MFFTRRLEQRIETLEKMCAQLIHSMQNSTTAALQAEIDDVRGAMDVMRASHRKELSAMWGKMGGRPREGTKWDDMTRQQPLIDVPSNGTDFEALLDLQQRPPAGPQ